MRRFFMLIAMLFLCGVLTGCPDDTPSSDQKMNQQQEQLSNAAAESVSLPSITKFAEKRHLKEILELRDKDKPTFTYVRDMNGRLHKVCDSFGFGLPYATQFTSPQKATLRSAAGHYELIVLPQADPNGLFSPAAAEGTWVLCLDPKTKEATPVYVEDRITVSPFELHHVED